MRLATVLCVLIILGSVSCAGSRPLVQPNAPLHINRVVLYQNGLAHVERRGKTDGRSVELRARRDQVDDVLKSLTVVDHAGGQVSSVRVLPSADDAEIVTLRVGLAEAGLHDLSISYVAEMSGWRPTYRIVADDDGRVRLQGLAVVDNHSGEPWHDIALSLSTDLPLSFRFALSTPRAAQRPQLNADGRLLQKVLPSVIDSGALASASRGIQAAYAQHNAYAPEMSNRAGVRLRGGVPQVNPEGPDQDPGDEAAAASTAEPVETEAVDPMLALDRSEGLVGTLLEGRGSFDLGEGESGLVPFVDEATDGGIVLLYKPATSGGPSSNHPYQAALFHNPLDAPLLTGPVAVYTGSQFLGDGVTGTIPARAHAFVAFALSPSVQITASTQRGEDHVRAVALRGGTLTVRLQATIRNRFRATSDRAWEERLYLFTPAVAGYQPTEPPDGTIVTDAGYYVPAPRGEAQATVDFELMREHTNSVDIAADPRHAYVPALIDLLSQEGRVDVAALERIVDRVEELRLLEQRAREDLQVRRAALEERRRALRSLRDVPANGALRRRLGASVAEGVAQIDELTRQIVAANAEGVALRQEWYEQLRNLDVGGA